MNKILLFVVITGCSYIAKAQTSQDVINNFHTILEDAKDDFKNIKGEVIATSSKYIYYTSNKTMGATSEAIFVARTAEGETYFYSKFYYNQPDQQQKADVLLPKIYKIVEELLETKKYNRKIYFDKDGVNGIEINDLEGKAVLNINIAKKEADENNYCLFVIHSRK